MKFKYRDKVGLLRDIPTHGRNKGDIATVHLDKLDGTYMLSFDKKINGNYWACIEEEGIELVTKIKNLNFTVFQYTFSITISMNNN